MPQADDQPGWSQGDSLLAGVESLSHLAIESFAIGLFVVGPDGVIAMVNSQTERQFGYEHHELAGRSINELLPDAVSDVHASRRMVWGRRKDGSAVPVEIGLNPVQTGAGSFVLVSVVDISERLRQAEEHRRALEVGAQARRQADLAMRTSEQLFRTLADGVPAMIKVSGPDRTCTWFNRQWLTFVGHPMEDELGGGWIRHVHPDDAQACMQVSALHVDAREPFSIDYRVRRHDGEWRWVHDRSTPTCDAEGAFTGYLGLSLDVTESRQATQAVERSLHKLQAENLYLRHEAKDRLGTEVVVGQSQAMRRVLAQIEQVAGTDSTVLLLGETGTGKELFATRIHELSKRRARPMVRVNCAAIPASLIESELFGREKGAFTGALARQIGRFELADHSTIFLDEIGDLPPDVQVKLLRVLEERHVERLGSPKSIHVDTRIIAATHRNLELRIADGAFREDLFYRLNVFPIELPALRDRVEDIPLLVWRFVEEFSQRFSKRIETIPKENMALLQRYSWPGNIRELRNVVERAMIVATGPQLTVSVPAPTPAAIRYSARLADVEKEHIRTVLDSVGWRIRGPIGAASRLGLPPTTLETRMAKLGLSRRKRES